MPKTTEHKKLEERFVSAFEMNVGRTLNGTNAKIQELRRQAIDRFRKLGFPGRKHESWKYTNIGAALRHEYKVLAAPPKADLTADEIDRFAIPDLEAHVVVLVNGRFSEELSSVENLPDGVRVTSLEKAAMAHSAVVDEYFGRYAEAEEEVFTALNTAFTLDGLFVYVPKGKVVDKPIHIINLQKVDDDLFLQPRHLLVFEAGSQARIIESGHSLSDAKTFTNSVSEVFVGERAVIDLYLVQDFGDQATHVTSTNAYQEASSVFSMNTVTFTGDIVRNNVNVLPNAEHCETHLYGLFLPRGETHVDNHTFVDHAKPDCQSSELYKGVLDDDASGVFNGKVFVRKDAQRINAFQENKSILLSETATMNSKPELEIYADDVKCSHGATTGQLDREALFYLRSRGIPEKQARGMLLHAFASDLIENVKLEPLRALLDKRVTERFGW